MTPHENEQCEKGIQIKHNHNQQANQKEKKKEKRQACNINYAARLLFLTKCTKFIICKTE